MSNVAASHSLPNSEELAMFSFFSRKPKEDDFGPHPDSIGNFDIDEALATMPPDPTDPFNARDLPDLTAWSSTIETIRYETAWASTAQYFNWPGFSRTRMKMWIDPFVTDYNSDKLLMPRADAYAIKPPVSEQNYMTELDWMHYKFLCKMLNILVYARRYADHHMKARAEEMQSTDEGIRNQYAADHCRMYLNRVRKDAIQPIADFRSTQADYEYAVQVEQQKAMDQQQQPSNPMVDMINKHPFLTGFLGTHVVRKLFGKN